MKVIIAGGRDFTDYKYLCQVCDYMLQNQNSAEIEIVSGTARGADKLGEQYAKEKGYKIAYFPADWDAFGKSAGYRRNVEMAEYGDVLIAFWDEKSTGTKHMIDIARDKGMRVKIAKYRKFK